MGAIESRAGRSEGAGLFHPFSHDNLSWCVKGAAVAEPRAGRAVSARCGWEGCFGAVTTAFSKRATRQGEGTMHAAREN